MCRSWSLGGYCIWGVEGITNMKDLYLLLACYGSIDRSYFKIAFGDTKLMFGIEIEI